MRYKFSTQRGETILEAVIAISVLMIVMVPASGMVVDSIRGSAGNRDNITADDLAVSGLELVQHVRDSNFRKFSSKPECWDTAPDHVDITTCDANKILSGSYTLSADSNFSQWTFLKIQNNPLPDDFDLSDSNYQLSGNQTAFYREIFMEHQPNEAIKAASRVFFRNGAQVKKVFRSALFYPIAQ